MRKILLAAICICSFSLLNAQTRLLNAISIVVDNEPITMYELFVLTRQFNITAQNAMELAIRQKLELIQIKNMNINVDDFALNQQINALAARENMDLQSFYNALAAQGISRETYRNEVKLNMQREKLYQYVLSTRFQNTSEQEALSYYNKNLDDFRRYESFNVVKFESSSSEDLENIDIYAYQKQIDEETMNATIEDDNSTENLTQETDVSSEVFDDANHLNNATKLAQNENISVSHEVLESASSEPRVVAILTQTEVGTQTPIFKIRNIFMRYLVMSKNNENLIPFEQAKNMIVTKIGSESENNILKEYFDTLKSGATITVIRLP